MEDQLLWKADFARLLKYDEANPKKDAKLYYRVVLSKLATGDSSWINELSQLQPSERDYFRSVALYKYAAKVEETLRAQAKLSDDEKILLLLATRIQNENARPTDASKLEAKLGSLFPAEWKEVAVSKPAATACFKELSWPKANEKEEVFTQKLQLGVARHQQCKKLVEGDMKNPLVPLEEKEDLAEDAADVERFIVKLIEQSPRPAGLSPEQLVQYNDGLKGLIAGYEKEAEEFEKLEAKIRGDRKSAKPSGVILLARPRKWEYPEFLSDTKNPKAVVLKRLISAEATATAALLYLDLLLVEKSIKQDVYENIRLGHLLQRFGKNKGVLRVLLDYVDTRGLKSLKAQWEDST